MADSDQDILLLEDADTEELRVDKPEEEQQLSEPEIHLLLGDSIARRMQSKLEVEPNDILLNRSRPGNSWGKLRGSLETEISCWKEAAETFGCTLGTCVIWMTGNDVYPRNLADRSHVVKLAPLESAVDDVLTSLWAPARRVMILGPLPRYGRDAGECWADCPGFAAQQATKRVCGEHPNVEFVPLGRSLTKMYKRWHLVGDDSGRYFLPDGVHLSPEGEEAVLHRIPAWLRWHPCPRTSNVAMSKRPE